MYGDRFFQTVCLKALEASQGRVTNNVCFVDSELITLNAKSPPYSSSPSPTKLVISRPGKNPVALFVCKASRNLALKRYKLFPGSRRIFANLKAQDSDILHVARDSLFVLESLASASPPDETARKIRDAHRIAINWNDEDACGREGIGPMGIKGSEMRNRLSTLFPNLKEVLLTGPSVEAETFRLPWIAATGDNFNEIETIDRRSKYLVPNELEWKVQNLARGFNEENLSGEEMINGLPKALVVLDLCKTLK